MTLINGWKAQKCSSDNKDCMEGWGKITAAAAYAGVSVRTFRDWLKAGLIHVKLPTGIILIRYDDIDAYLKRYNVTKESEAMINGIVNEIIEGLK